MHGLARLVKRKVDDSQDNISISNEMPLKFNLRQTFTIY